MPTLRGWAKKLFGRKDQNKWFELNGQQCTFDKRHGQLICIKPPIPADKPPLEAFNPDYDMRQPTHGASMNNL